MHQHLDPSTQIDRTLHSNGRHHGAPPLDNSALRTLKRRRSKSPDHAARERHNHHVHGHRSQGHRLISPPTPILPYKQRPLHKRDFSAFQAIFAEYLDVQKHLDINTLPHREVQGRWKSFIKKWNILSLPEGWYDPNLRDRVNERWVPPGSKGRLSPESREGDDGSEKQDNGRGNTALAIAHDHGNTDRVESGAVKGLRADTESEDSAQEDDDYGPAPAPARKELVFSAASVGPTIPHMQDLQYRNELLAEEATRERRTQAQNRKIEYRQEVALAKQRMNDLAPRAEPGSKERQLEKKRETAAANRAFREETSGGGGGIEEVGDGELMGGGAEDEVEGLKKQIKEREKAKTHRETKREEIMRARAAEREVRIAAHREKEEKTLEMLRAIARQRFG